MKDKLIIIGAGGHGKVVADIARKVGYSEIAFLDDNIKKKKNSMYNVIGTMADVEDYRDEYDFFVGIGNNEIRKNITLLLESKGILIQTLIHPSAIIGEMVEIGDGSIIMANTVINADTKIGKGCIINTSSSVDHDCIVNEYVHICPGVHLAGTVTVGREVFLGIGAIVINNVYITDNCIIGAGSVVVKNLETRGVYRGVPAKLNQKVKESYR